jgi:amino acid adenylation domain-containing protein
MNTNDIETSFKLSPMQQGMLFHHQLEPGSGVDIEQMACSLREDLDVGTFKKAWDFVVARHQALRTSFQWEGKEEPLQYVHSSVKLPFELKDWQHLPADKQQNEFAEYLKRDRKKGFDLTEAPLMRVALFRVGEADYQAVWTFHHIIADGRSHPVILGEVFSVYDAICHGGNPCLQQARSYEDYIQWLSRQDFQKSEQFWRNLLKGFNAPNAIGTFQADGRSDDKYTEYAEHELRISEQATTALRALAQENHLTLNTVVQGAWALLLSRYSGEEDVVFGTVRAGRNWADEAAASMVGLFINTVPLRVRVSPEKSLIPWLKDIRQLQIDTREHENTPLVDIQGWSNVPRGMSLFESLFVFDNYDLTALLQSRGESWHAREFRLIEKTGYPLTIYGYAESALLLKISYDSGRFDSDTIKRTLGHLKSLLEAAAQDPARSLAMLPLLTDSERHQLLVEWNATEVDYPRDKRLHELFEAQAERTPDSVAVVYEGEELTYRELNNRTNQLGHYLQKLGVGPDVFVGVFMERSLEMVIAIYGIVKAGGAYVPLDPEYPPDRVAFMAKDTRVPVLLTQKHLVTKLIHSDARVICLDSEWSTIAGETSDNFNNGTTAENLAYVIYTSGSTGLPKGVMNTHRGICNRLLWMQDAYHLTEEDRVLQKTPFSFDVSVWEFFWPLLTGARLIVARPGGHKDSSYLVKLIREQGITTLHFVPSMLEVFLDDNDVEKCSNLKRVICSGEALPYELQERFFTKLPAELHNLYGPTEAAVDVTYWACKRHDSRRIVPIGYPVANTKLYILDTHFQPVPIGVPGELYIGGVQVARGYLNRPELNAEKFIPDPFSKHQEGRLYRTGDVARYLPGGEIEYLGRTDHQVKIRGFRIELGEIEAALGEHEGVRQAVVMAREDTPGDKQLVAYMVPEGDRIPSVSELRQYLGEKLPEYMVPGAFVMLEVFPLSPNGKIDRKALPVPELHRLTTGSDYVAPQTDFERTIASIWQSVLHVEKIGINDNFFDLGGHSLRMAQVHSRLREKLQRDLSMLDMFKYPTINSLAQYLSSSQGVNEQISLKKSDDRTEKLQEGKNRLKKRFRHREQTDQDKKSFQDV